MKKGIDKIAFFLYNISIKRGKEMNPEVIKAIKSANKNNSFKRKAVELSQNILKVILFPIERTFRLKIKVNDWLNSKNTWSEERANEILSYYIPREAEWYVKDNLFYFADNGLGWNMKCNLRKIKLRDRRWWRINTGFYGGKVRTYLLEKFELEGFEKIVGDTYDHWTEVTFKMKDTQEKGNN